MKSKIFNDGLNDNGLSLKKVLKNTTWMLIVVLMLITSIVTFANAATPSTAGSSGTTVSGFSDTASTAISIALLNQNPDPAIAGQTADLKLSVTNSGSASSSQNLIVEVVPTYPFIAVNGANTVQNAGPMNSFQYQSKTMTYTLMIDKDAAEGLYPLQVEYYPEGQKNTSLVSQSIIVDVGSSQNVEVIHIDKTVLVPGQQSDMKFQITNVGGSALHNMKFSWGATGNVVLPVGSDNTQYIKYLDVGASTELDYQVIADTNAAAGLYPLTLNLAYTDPLTNNVTSYSTVAGVYIGGGTDFEVAYSSSASGTTSFTIANIGSNPATSVSVLIPQQPGWSVTGSNSVIVGNLNKGDYTVASYMLQQRTQNALNFTRRNAGAGSNISANPTSGPNAANYPAINNAGGGAGVAGGNNGVMMQIAYTDTMGNRIIVNKTVSITAGNSGNITGFAGRTGAGGATRARTPSYTIWYIVGAIVILVAGFLIYRRRRMKLLLDPDKVKDKSRKKQL